MSYADVAKENAPAGGDQPQNWENEVKKDVNEGLDRAEKAGKEFGKKARHELDEAETAIAAAWQKTKEVILRPSTLGGLVGVVNVGLLGGLGYVAYQERNRPWDQKVVASTIGGLFALFATEGYVTDSYLHTPEGKAEAERAKKEGSKAYLHAKEVILRPNVAGGLAGIFNLAVIGGVSFVAYRHWNEVWDRKIVAGVTAGLLALTGIEGALGKEYVDKELPKQK